MKASVNGVITNFDLRPGDYVTAGHAVTALVDTDSIHVDGYFEETKLGSIAPGRPGDGSAARRRAAARRPG